MNFQPEDDEVHFILDNYAYWIFYNDRSLKQEFVDRHVATLAHIILIPNQPANAECLATNANFIVVGLTR